MGAELPRRSGSVMPNISGGDQGTEKSTQHGRSADRPHSADTPDPLMMVDSEALTAAAENLRATEVPSALLRNGVRVTPEQLDAAAGILRAAEPSVITSPRRLASTQERPGWIDADQQDDSDTLFFVVGILPSSSYRIDPKGVVADG